MELKLVRMGNSVGMVLPKAVRARMKLASGDAVYLTETPGGYEITPYDPDFSHQMEVARKVMKNRRAALHELAK